MENWYWIELIGFDNTQEDYGVKHFVENVPQIKGVSLLFSNIDFVNCHTDSVTEQELLPCDCSYGGHKYSEERERQVWTNFQLKGLIGSLHSYGIKVLFSFFNIFTWKDDNGNTVLGDFCRRNPQIWDYNDKGENYFAVNVLKHIKDNALYEDFLFEKIREVAAYYRFDGVQIADGISSARPSVQNGDFSDDIIGQFIENTGILLPDYLKKAGGNKEKYVERRNYIIKNLYFEYLKFLSNRWGSYYKKMISGLSKDNLIVLFNNCWTRGPFEAYYRYGFDYRKIYDSRFYGMIFEEVSATQPIYSAEDQGGFELDDDEVRKYINYEYSVSTKRLKCYLPDLKQIALSPVKDTFEQWDVLRHSYTEMERAVYNRNNNFILASDGYKKVFDGALFCLCDSMKKSDWEIINAFTEKSCLPEIQGVYGFTALWSDYRLEKELKYYIDTKKYTSQKLEHELIKNGLSVAAMARTDALNKINSPVLICNYQFFSEREKTEIENSSLPMLLVGKGKLKKNADFSYSDRNITVGIYNQKADENVIKPLLQLLKQNCKTKKFADSQFDRQGGIWTAPLQYREIEQQFFKALCENVNVIFNNFEVLSNDCKIVAYKLQGNKIRFLISNDKYNYMLPKIKLSKKIKSIRSVIKYQGYKVSCGYSEFNEQLPSDIFSTRVPPRGMDIVEVECQD